MNNKNTIIERFLDVATRHPDAEALGYYDGATFKIITYRGLKDAVISFAGHLAGHGVKAGDTCALLLENGPDWVVADFAVAYLGGISVPIHTTYNEHYVEYILTHADIKYLFVDGSLVGKIARAIAKPMKIRSVIVRGQLPGSFPKNDLVHSHESFMRVDPKEKIEPHQGSGEDIHTIVYTSGTTGVPKGAVLTNGNILSNVDGAKEYISVDHTDRFLSFLPLSHILERTAGYYVPLLSGSAVYFARSSKTLSEDMKLAKPTILISVPRVFEKAHEKIMAKFSSPLLHRIFKHAMHHARRQNAWQGFYGATLFKKIKTGFGGRLRFAVSGGAALPKHIAEFFEALGILIVEGYGLTETSPILTMNTIGKYRFGTVGIPLKNVQIKIGSDGEILAKGAGLMREYYHAPDLTGVAIDREGWFHTGDKGSVDPDGFLTIEGRIKEMLVLSTGRNVFPVPIEQALEESPYIEQAMVYAEGHAIAGLIVPSFDELKICCVQNAIPFSMPAVLTDSRVMDFYRSEIEKRLSRMQHYELLRNFVLVPKAFTQEEGLLTPTQKLKREEILRHSLK